MRGLDSNGCHTRIYGGRGFGWQCTKKVVVTRNGKRYCKIHDPEYIAEKRRKWQEKFDKEWAKKEIRWALEEARAKAINGLTLEELKQVTPERIRAMLKEDK